MTLQEGQGRARRRGRLGDTLFRWKISQGLVVLLFATVAIVAGERALAAVNDLAMVESVEVVRSAHAKARTVAAASGSVVRMQLMASDGHVRVWRERGGQLDVLLDAQTPAEVWIHSDVELICFDERGRPLLAQGCEEQRGAISIGTRRGEETWLTLTPDGQLVWSGSTVRD